MPQTEYEIKGTDYATVSNGVNETNNKEYWQVTIGETDYWCYDRNLLEKWFLGVYLMLKATPR